METQHSHIFAAHFEPLCRNPDALLAEVDASFDIVTRTPSDFAFSPQFSFQLSDWVVSGSDSYISPIVRSSAIQTPFRCMSSPSTTSFLDLIQTQQSSSPAIPNPDPRCPPGLLSPLKLSSPVSCSSSKKENFRQAFDAFPSPILASPAPSFGSVSRRQPQSHNAPLPSLVPRLTTKLIPLSPLSPWTPSPNQPQPVSTVGAKSKKRRLSASSLESPIMSAKRTRNNTVDSNQYSADSTADGPPAPVTAPLKTRTFPSSGFSYSASFPRFYRRFPTSSYFCLPGSDSPLELFGVKAPGGQYRAPRNAFDLYSARFVKGKGVEKVGLCPICIEPVERGGEEKTIWLSMKFSAFNYHMQHYHGISASTGRPLSPPIDFRVVDRAMPKKGERAQVQEGKCHKCAQWIVIQTIKDVDVKVPELFWWKHAVGCHSGSVLAGEGDVFEEDEVYHALKELGL
ncbi:hypothetical protein C8F01DRAFT_1100554 [Mycena amicta]|nr:hypothetical protein C8F01DRAFT_1100554 [Mycena amicta]